MAFAVIFSPEFGSWFDEQENSLQRAVLVYVGLLEEGGPQLSRPYADTLKGTRLNNLKELRVQYRGNPYRILYAFDPERQALLLVGGNKAGDRRWYDRMIPVAETLFERHLEDLEKEKDDDDRTTH
ncbi:type II toxin-antitoxin system RelE/ParE family toxin [soil metagenome]